MMTHTTIATENGSEIRSMQRFIRRASRGVWSERYGNDDSSDVLPMLPAVAVRAPGVGRLES